MPLPRRRTTVYGEFIRTLILNKVLGASEAPHPVPVRRDLYVRRFLSLSEMLLKKAFAHIEVNVSENFERSDSPLVVYTNHPSFWDPLLCGQVLSELFPDRSLYAPIDETALKKHWYFNGLGFFALKLDSLEGLRTFLKVGRAVLDQVERPCLVLAPEGRFTEPSSRPIHLKRGLSKLLSGGFERGAQVLPIALDYRLGAETRPNAWVTVGNSYTIEPGTQLEQKLLHGILEKHLTEAMDRNLELIQTEPTRLEARP